MLVRKELPEDHPFVDELIRIAFENQDFSDHDEHFLVQRLREGKQFIPELSLVAEIENRIVGYVLFTPIIIRGEIEDYPTLSLAPIAVLPEFQKQGVGTALIKEGHKIAKELGYKSVIVLGHPEYYPKFGYQKSSNFGIYPTLEVPEDYFMAIELVKGSLKNVNGKVIYPPEFINNDLIV